MPQNLFPGSKKSYVGLYIHTILGSLLSFAIIFICHLRSFAVICGRLQLFGVIYSCYLRLFAVVCGLLQLFAVIYNHKYIQFEGVCNHLWLFQVIYTIYMPFEVLCSCLGHFW